MINSGKRLNHRAKIKSKGGIITWDFPYKHGTEKQFVYYLNRFEVISIGCCITVSFIAQPFENLTKFNYAH